MYGRGFRFPSRYDTLSSLPSLEQSEQIDEQAGHSSVPSWSHSPSEAPFSSRTGSWTNEAKYLVWKVTAKTTWVKTRAIRSKFQHFTHLNRKFKVARLTIKPIIKQGSFRAKYKCRHWRSIPLEAHEAEEKWSQVSKSIRCLANATWLMQKIFWIN